MSNRAGVVALTALPVLVSCATDPVDLWVGRYSMTLEERTWSCDAPDAAPEIAESDVDWLLERDAIGELALEGECRLSFSSVTATRAEVRYTVCRPIVDGRVFRVELLSGALMLEGEQIVGVLNSRAESEDGVVCLVSKVDAFGVRVE